MKKESRFKRWFSDFVVKNYKTILGVAILLLIPAAIGMMQTRVNYDMLNYLPDSMETVQGQDELLNDFGKGAFSMVVVEDATDEKVADLTDKIRQIDHVETAISYSALTENDIPVDVLPDDILTQIKNGDKTLIAVFFDTSTSSEETMNAVSDIREVVDGEAYVSGMSALVSDLRNLCASEEITYVIIAVALVLLVMLILLDNWLTPFLLLASIGIAILINMGTNIVFGEISYITKALSAILQLAVTMDYSIFLWHSYHEHRERGIDNKEAMRQAVKDTLSSVVGSSITTIAGFIALCFMTFTLGFDLGMVMAKGVLIGVIGSVTILPALILAFSKPLEKTQHRSIMPKFDKLSNLIIKAAPILAVIFVVIIPVAFYGYQQTQDNVYYELSKSLPSDMEFAIANSKLSEDFGISNVQMALTDASLGQDEMAALTTELENVDGVAEVLNLESVVGTEIPLEALPDSIVDILKSDKWELSLIVTEYKTATPEISTQISELTEILKKYDSSSLLIGEAACTEDMIKLTDADFQRVNLVSIVAIFIIIAIVTQSISLPVILIAVIEVAVFINLGLSYYTGEQLSFIAPICISTIQLGATVDYAILMTTRYKTERRNGKDKKQAVKIALSTSLSSILVSGIGLFAATIGVAAYSQADMISSMCMLMARGAIISILAVALFLPPLLTIFDKIICKTTKNMLLASKGEENE